MLALIMDNNEKKANSKKSFTRKIVLLMLLLFGVDVVAILLQIVSAFFNLNADLADLISMFSMDFYFMIHIIM
jgi:hypothetical protein